MSERKDLAAFTAPGSSYPAFINFSRVDGAIEVTIRSKAKEPVAPSDMAVIRLSSQEFGRLVGELIERSL